MRSQLNRLVITNNVVLSQNTKNCNHEEFFSRQKDVRVKKSVNITTRRKSYSSKPFSMGELLEKGEVETYSSETVFKTIENLIVTGLSNNIKTVKTGNLFFCISEQDPNWLSNALMSFEKGAHAVICDVRNSEKLTGLSKKNPIIEVDDPYVTMGRLAKEFYSNPSGTMKVIGVSGSGEKSTATWLIRGILEETENLTGLIGNIEYALAEQTFDEEGVFITETDPMGHRACSSPFHFTPYPMEKKLITTTTPDALKIQHLMAVLAERGADACIIEYSPTRLNQGCCDNVEFDIAVHTQITTDHDYSYKTFESYITSRLKLFRLLSNPEKQWSIINTDCIFSADFVAASNKVPIVTYSISEKDADVYAEKIEISIFDTSLLINTPLNTRLKIVSRLLGKSNVYNILSAVATGVALGSPLNRIANGIEIVELVPGSCELVDEGQDFAVVVDSAERPGDLSTILDNMRDCKPSRIITVFGCCGDHRHHERAQMGEIAHFKSDIVIVTNHNPRSEAPDQIIKDIVAGWPDDILLRQNWLYYPWYQDIGRLPLWCSDQALWVQSSVGRYIIEDRYLAIRCAIYSAQHNDLVLILGKGQRDFQEWIGGHVYDAHEKEIKDKKMILKHIIKGWFDDRLECRKALLHLPRLNGLMPDLDRSVMPWMWPGLHRRHPLEDWDYEGSGYISATHNTTRKTPSAGLNEILSL